MGDQYRKAARVDGIAPAAAPRSSPLALRLRSRPLSVRTIAHHALSLVWVRYSAKAMPWKTRAANVEGPGILKCQYYSVLAPRSRICVAHCELGLLVWTNRGTTCGRSRRAVITSYGESSQTCLPAYMRAKITQVWTYKSRRARLRCHTRDCEHATSLLSDDHCTSSEQCIPRGGRWPRPSVMSNHQAISSRVSTSPTRRTVGSVRSVHQRNGPLR